MNLVLNQVRVKVGWTLEFNQYAGNQQTLDVINLQHLNKITKTKKTKTKREGLAWVQELKNHKQSDKEDKNRWGDERILREIECAEV